MLATKWSKRWSSKFNRTRTSVCQLWSILSEWDSTLSSSSHACQTVGLNLSIPRKHLEQTLIYTTSFKRKRTISGGQQRVLIRIHQSVKIASLTTRRKNLRSPRKKRKKRYQRAQSTRALQRQMRKPSMMRYTRMESKLKKRLKRHRRKKERVRVQLSYLQQVVSGSRVRQMFQFKSLE